MPTRVYMMLRLLPISALCLSLVAVSACQRDAEPESTQAVGFRPGTRTTANPQPTPTTRTTQLPPDMGPDAQAVNATPPPPAPTPAPVVKKVTGDVPYGIPVPGKPGQVLSPHSPDAGPIDVHGYAPGQEVVDPLTGKSFLVP